MNPSMDPEDDVELAAHVQARARVDAAGAVVAVRVPRDLLARMIEYGRLRGMTMSEVLRHGAESLIDGRAGLPANTNDRTHPG